MSEPSTIRVAGVQCDPKLGDVPGNLAMILDRAEAAAEQGARLVVFPECALSGYGFPDRAEAMKFAQTIPGPAAERVKNLCASRGLHVIFGMLERDGDRLFNACALVGPTGVVGSYRKIHLPYLGVDRFADPGDRPFAVQDAGGVRVGMHICYDGSFPESGRVLSLLGADLLVLPTNWPTHSECAAQHMIATRALENTVYSMAVNRVGEESGFRFIGQSSICDQGGRILAFASGDREETIFADADPEKARRKKIIRVPKLHEIDRINDRRPEFYGPIAAPKSL